MSAIKDGSYPIMLDKERHLLFSLNVLDELQDKAGGFDNLDVLLSGKDLFKNLKWLMTLAINEGAAEGEEPITELQVGKLIHAGNLDEILRATRSMFKKGTNGDEQPNMLLGYDGDDDEKNKMSGQGQ